MRQAIHSEAHLHSQLLSIHPSRASLALALKLALAILQYRNIAIALALILALALAVALAVATIHSGPHSSELVLIAHTHAALLLLFTQDFKDLLTGLSLLWTYNQINLISKTVCEI